MQCHTQLLLIGFGLRFNGDGDDRLRKSHGLKNNWGSLGGERIADVAAQQFWQGLREQSAAYFAGDLPLWRLSLPSVAPPLDLPGAQLVEWGGAQRWLRPVTTTR